MLTASRLLVILVTTFATLWLLDQLDFIPKATRIVSFSSLAIFSTSSVSAELPNDNLASEQFSAWLTAFNTHDRDTILAYHEKHFPYDVASSDIGNIDREMSLSRQTGGFDIVDILDSQNDEQDSPPSHILTVVLREKKPKGYAKARMTVDPEDRSHPVTDFEIHPTHTPLKFVPDDKKEEYERALAPLTPEKRRLVVKEISEVIQKDHVNPDIGEKIIRMLKAKEKGEYNMFTDSEEFARQLTKDARSMDKHMGILFFEPPPNPKRRDDDDDDGGGNGDEKNKCPPDLYDHLKEMNFGFDNPSVESIGTKKLGILGIKGFVPLGTNPNSSNCPQIIEAVGSFMSQIADTDALIIDLRSNRGGVPDTVAFVESYLMGGDGEDDDSTVHLIDFVDRNGTVKRSVYTLPPSKLPQNSTRFGSSKPLFVLTSKNTISGGEDFAYNLQVFKRAQALISKDKTTAGAGNLPGRPRFIVEKEFGKRWWLVVLPDLTARSTVTGTNWEGVGVVTDVVVGEDEDVVDVAREMARKALGLDKDLGGDYEL